MTYERILWLPAVLRAAGLEVVEHAGWETRGLSTSQRFEPRHIVWHHDASAVGDSPGVPAYMIRNFNSAGAQLWVDRKGRWHIVASGRAAHAGDTRGGVDNYNSIGIETDHTTGEDWPAELLYSLRRGTAAMLAHMETRADVALHFHKSICEPPGRKVDPDGLDLDKERQRVAAVDLVDRSAWPVVSLARAQKIAKRATWAQSFTGPKVKADRALIKRALARAGADTYVHYQRKTKAARTDGVPGKADLNALGEIGKFRVSA